MISYSVLAFLFIQYITAYGIPIPEEAGEISNITCKATERINRESRQCHLLGAPCDNTEEIFYNDIDGFGKCDCDFTKYSRSQIDSKCYAISTQGPCSSTEWIPPGGLGKLSACERNPCLKEQEEDKTTDGSDENGFWFFKDNKCWKTRTQAFCTDSTKVVKYKYFGPTIIGEKVLSAKMPIQFRFHCLIGFGMRNPMNIGSHCTEGTSCQSQIRVLVSNKEKP